MTRTRRPHIKTLTAQALIKVEMSTGLRLTKLNESDKRRRRKSKRKIKRRNATKVWMRISRQSLTLWPKSLTLTWRWTFKMEIPAKRLGKNANVDSEKELRRSLKAKTKPSKITKCRNKMPKKRKKMRTE